MVTRELFRSHSEGVLDFWQRARDNEDGGFYCDIAADGTVVRCPYRALLVQTRLLHNYSMGTLAGVSFAREHADHLYEFITSRLGTEHGWYASLLRGELDHPEVLNTYDNVFVVIAFARYALATGRRDVLDEAWQCLEVVEEAAVEGDMASSGLISFDPEHGSSGSMTRMYAANYALHYIEALACLRDVRQDAAITRRAERIREFFMSRILDHGRNVTRDHFETGYDSPCSGPDACSYLGHSLEWIDFFRCFPGLELGEEIERGIYGRVAAAGVKSNGMFVNKYLLETNRAVGGSVFWGQMEAIRAYDLAYSLYGSPYDEVFHRLCCFYFGRFVDTDGGVFCGFSADGDLTLDHKGNSWKCGYHAVRMCSGVISRPGGVLENGEDA